MSIIVPPAAKQLLHAERRALAALRSSLKPVVSHKPTTPMAVTVTRDALERAAYAQLAALHEKARVAGMLAARRDIEDYADDLDDKRPDHRELLLLLLLLMGKPALAAGAEAAHLFGTHGRDRARVAKEDSIARLVAGSIATSWALSAMTGNDNAISDALLRRIAATETSRAYNGGRRDEFNRVVTGARAAGHDVVMVEEWDTILDGRECSECLGMHGARTSPGSPFRGGLQPGWVHPFCRCISRLITITLTAREREAA